MSFVFSLYPSSFYGVQIYRGQGTVSLQIAMYNLIVDAKVRFKNVQYNVSVRTALLHITMVDTTECTKRAQKESEN